MRFAPILIILLMTSPATAQTQPAAISYPKTRATSRIDEQFGEKIADPYRWLENDVRNDPEVKAWVDAENKLSSAYLASLPGRDIFAAR
ncbi:MAG: hypothetical protein RL367_1890, partial [Pseudomonadota bacterium]